MAKTSKKSVQDQKFGKNTELRSTINLLLAVLTTILDSTFLYGYLKSILWDTADVMSAWLRIESTNTLQKHSNSSDFKKHDNVVGEDMYTIFSMLFKNKYSILKVALSTGGIIGSIIALNFMRAFGRRGGLLMTTFINFFAALFIGYSKYFDSAAYLIIGRICFGIKCGINCVIAPIYISEIVPANMKAKYGVLYILFIPIGTLISGTVCNYLGTNDYWPLVHSLAIIPAIIQLVILPLCPESPKYLYVIKGKEFECKKALMWLRGPKYNEEELISLRREFYQRKLLGNIKFKTIIANNILRHALAVSVVMMLSRQVCGISGIVAIFKEYFAHQWNVISWLLIGMTIICIMCVDLISRRKVLISTFIVMAFASISVSISLGLRLHYLNINQEIADWIMYHLFISLVMFMAAFQVGIGSLVWILPGELFNTATVPYPYVIGCTLNWTFQLLIICIYLPLQRYLGYLSFLNFMLINLINAHFVYTMLPDTRGKSIKEIYRSIHLMLQESGVML